VKGTRGLWASIIFIAILVAASLAGFASGNLKPKLGLDLQGGVQVILAAPQGTDAGTMAQTLSNIRRRVDLFGVGESQIFVSGNTITVQIPGGANGSLTKQSKSQYCLTGSDGTVYGCSTDKATVDQALKDFTVQTQPSRICVEDPAGQQLQCFSTLSEAQVLQAQIQVAPKASPAPTPSGTPSAAPSGTSSATPSPTVSPTGASLNGSSCLVDSTGTELACYKTPAAAAAAKKGLTTKTTENTYCVIDSSSSATSTPSPSATPSASKKPSATPSGSASPSASSTASPTPSAYVQLDRSTAAPLPCGLKTQDDANKALAALAVNPYDTQYCVKSSGGKDEGCFVRRSDAEQQLKEIGTSQLLASIGQTARLEERQVLGIISPQQPQWAATPLTCSTVVQQATPACQPAQLDGKKVVYLDPSTNNKYELGPVVISGVNIKKATAAIPQDQNSVGTQWVINFDLTGPQAKDFANLTAQLASLPSTDPTKQIAIIVDKQIISSPAVIAQITTSGQITGSFTEDGAKALANQLNAGSLPVQLTRLSVTTVSPTLGAASLKQGIIAGLAGLILLFLYMLFYYRLLGVVAWFGMTIWAILAIAIVSLAGRVGYALSLAGIAGLVISLGVTADSYIVFFERLKDEVRNGKSPRSAVQPAFKRAYRTIVAADMVTAIAAVILYLTAVSSVRGFALTLGVATMLDLFVVWFFKRPTVFLIARNDRLVSLRGFGLASGVAAESHDAPAAVQIGDA
jgi:preprotein translocase subunit SecD